MTKEESWESSVTALVLLAQLLVSVLPSMARQPEVQGRLFTVFILASAFVEALALIGFVVTLIA